MLLLTGTSDLITVITDATADIEAHASWMDNAAGTITPGRTNTASITTATTTTVVGSPAASTQRNVKHLSFHNNHASTACLLRVVHTDGTTTEEMIHATLLAGEALVLDQTGKWTHYDVNGADYSHSISYVDAALGISGSIAETIPRQICTETNTAAPTASGTLFMMAIFLRAGKIVTNISFHSATTAAGTPTNGFFALYDGSRNLLAQSANFTTEAWAANTIKTKAMTSPYTVPITGLYYVAIMVTATTVPTLKGNTARTGGQLASQAPIIAGASTTGLTTSLPNPAAAITANSLLTVWAAIT